MTLPGNRWVARWLLWCTFLPLQANLLHCIINAKQCKWGDRPLHIEAMYWTSSFLKLYHHSHSLHKVIWRGWWPLAVGLTAVRSLCHWRQLLTQHSGSAVHCEGRYVSRSPCPWRKYTANIRICGATLLSVMSMMPGLCLGQNNDTSRCQLLRLVGFSS